MKYHVALFDQTSGRINSRSTRDPHSIEKYIKNMRRVANQIGLHNFMVRVYAVMGHESVILETQLKRQDKRKYIIRKNNMACKKFLQPYLGD